MNVESQRRLSWTVRILIVSMAATSGIATEPLLLENEYIRITIDPLRGAAVTSLLYKRALTFPLIASKGAGIAGTGALFAPVLEIGGASMTPSTVARLSGTAATFSGVLAPGLFFERHLRLGPHESGFSITDVVRNDTGRNAIIRIGTSSRQQSEPWRLTDRSWIGDSARTLDGASGAPSNLQVSSGPFFWRQIEEYGTGFLYQVRPVGTPLDLDAKFPVKPGEPAQVTWKSAALTVPAHGARTVESIVSIDEGGGPPDQRNVPEGMMLRSDIARAGRSGQPLAGFATVVSSTARRVQLVASEVSGRELARADLTLEPGKVARMPVTVTPAAKGDLAIRVLAVNEEGRQIGSVTAHTSIDGGSADQSSDVWKTYTSQAPEEYYRGTWMEIGEQMAHNEKRIGAPSSLDVTKRKGPSSGEQLAFYAKRFPFYSDLMAGVAKATGAAPTDLALADRAARDGAACMDIAFYGPDGPINAFSKERSGTSFKGLGYVKVVPARGYPFHMYMNYGVNSEGLSTSGATLNEDERTHAADFKTLAEWKQSGKHIMPMAMWMLLAMCKNVSEALAMIENPEAPLEFTGNLLLLDREGNAARVESGWGSIIRIFRREPKPKRLLRGRQLSASSAPTECSPSVPAGGGRRTRCCASNFCSNTQAIARTASAYQDVLSLMQTHEAGGMCQHIYDNPGVLYSSCSFIAVTRTKELWLSQGPPCQVQYVRHTLPSSY